jgi:putative drug exporter of the RND superfamily
VGDASAVGRPGRRRRRDRGARRARRRLELGQPDDRNLGTDATQRIAYDRLAEGFGAGAGGPLVVAVDGPQKDAQQLERRIAADPEVAEVVPAVMNEAGDTAVITVIPKHGPQDEATRELVERLREGAIPDSGATAYVGGRTARFGDEAEKIAGRIPLFAAAVVGLSLIMLLVAFRSWRISVLSAVFNLASIAAAYGVVTLAFQTAAGASLLGVEQQPVVPYVPLFMFAILFGLSTDYNVFLLSRVREEWDRHAGHREAIAAASAGTRRIITAAGGIMIAVFMGFDRSRPRDQDDRARPRDRRPGRRDARPAVHGARGAVPARRPAVAGSPREAARAGRVVR